MTMWRGFSAVLALPLCASTRLDLPTEEQPLETQPWLQLLTTAVSVNPRADMGQAFQEPYFRLKNELAFWMRQKGVTEIDEKDVSVYKYEKRTKMTADGSDRYLISWFVYPGNNVPVSEEQANGTVLTWRTENLPLPKEPFAGAVMLETTLLVGQDILEKITLTGLHQRMLKDELAFWMNGQRGRTTPVHAYDITVTKVEDVTKFSATSDKYYKITWCLTFSNGAVTKDQAKTNYFQWRDENTFDRFPRNDGLNTTFYFEKDAHEYWIVTDRETRGKQLQDRLAVEFELRATDINVTAVESDHTYELYTGRRYIVTWSGPCSTEMAKTVIEWGKQDSWEKPV